MGATAGLIRMKKVTAFELDPFIRAMNHTFRDMADIDLSNDPIETVASDYLHADVHSKIALLADVSTNVGIIAEERASLLLTLSEKGAIAVAKMITGKDLKLYDRLVADSVGELLNMIAGSAQRASSLRFQFSIPVSMQGKRHEIRTVSNSTLRYSISHFGIEEVRLILCEGF